MQLLALQQVELFLKKHLHQAVSIEAVPGCARPAQRRGHLF